MPMIMKIHTNRNRTMANTSFTLTQRTTRRFHSSLVATGVAGSIVLSSILGTTATATAASEQIDLTPGSGGTEMIVMAQPGHLSEVVSSLERTGVKIGRRLPVINGVTITAKYGSEHDIAAIGGVRAVSEDGWMTPVHSTTKATERAMSGRDKDKTDKDKADKDKADKDKNDKPEQEAKQDQAVDTEDSGTTASGSRDGGSLEAIARSTGARKLWRRGITGKGVDIALIDTGIVPVAGGPTVVNGADLSTDAAVQSLRFLDGFGHGTHLAGIIGGHDAGVDPLRQNGGFVGIAPDSRVVNVKVGGMDGRVHVSQVIAGLDWVVQNKTANGMNIRVINLAYSAPSSPNWQQDPLAWAAEVAWRKGIVVVAAAGNDGTGHELSSPASSPEILAVGATDVESVRGAHGDYNVAAYTSTGIRRRPDLFVPGSHIISLRVKGSFVDTYLAKANIDDRLTRGSGTSQAAAVTSGLVALLIQKYPAATPDQIKAMLAAGTDISTSRKDVTGIQASIDVYAAVKSAKKALPSVTPTDPFVSCEPGVWCRGIADGSQGYIDWAKAAWNGASWGGTTWNGGTWTGASWGGSSWTNNAWNGASWGGASWNGASWNGASWGNATWTGASWGGASWGGASWGGTSWSGTTWSGTTWSGTTWSGTQWSGTQWASSDWSN
jgi:serine protease AprX